MTQSVSVSRIQGLNGSLAIKVPCRVASTANLTLSGLQAVDGVTVVADDRVLVKSQTTASQNGIYIASTSTWQRSLDFNGANDVMCGTLIAITAGTVNANTIWQLTTTGTITPGTTSTTFALAVFAAGGTFTAPGTGGVTRTTQSKLAEADLSVVDYGATVSPANSNAAFLLAQAANGYTLVPDGLWLVNKGLSSWKFYGTGTVREVDGDGSGAVAADNGAVTTRGKTWQLPRAPQSDTGMFKVYRNGTYGNYEQATAASITMNYIRDQTVRNTQVTGGIASTLASSNNPERGAVALFVAATPPDCFVLGYTTTYTATTLVYSGTVGLPTDPAGAVVAGGTTLAGGVSALVAAGHLKVGMFINTRHATSCSGQIQSWDSATNTITVDGWYQYGMAAPNNVTPTDNVGAVINPSTSVWTANFVANPYGFKRTISSTCPAVDTAVINVDTTGMQYVMDQGHRIYVTGAGLPDGAYVVTVYNAASLAINVATGLATTLNLTYNSFTASGCSGLEIDMRIPDTAGGISDTVGVDVFTMTGRADVHYSSRSPRVYAYRSDGTSGRADYAFYSTTDDTGFTAVSAVSKGMVLSDCIGGIQIKVPASAIDASSSVSTATLGNAIEVLTSVSVSEAGSNFHVSHGGDAFLRNTFTQFETVENAFTIAVAATTSTNTPTALGILPATGYGSLMWISGQATTVVTSVSTVASSTRTFNYLVACHYNTISIISSSNNSTAFIDVSVSAGSSMVTILCSATTSVNGINVRGKQFHG